MALRDEITALEKALADGGANLTLVLREAGVNRSTWTRWKNGSVKYARYDTITKVKDTASAALRKAASEAPQPRSAA